MIDQFRIEWHVEKTDSIIFCRWRWEIKENLKLSTGLPYYVWNILFSSESTVVVVVTVYAWIHFDGHSWWRITYNATNKVWLHLKFRRIWWICFCFIPDPIPKAGGNWRHWFGKMWKRFLHYLPGISLYSLPGLSREWRILFIILSSQIYC